MIRRASFRVTRTLGVSYGVGIDKLVEDNMHLIYKYAIYYKQRYGGTQQEWLGPVAIGVIEAARSWDESKGVGFETYANYRIRGACSKYAFARDAGRIDFFDPDEVPPIPDGPNIDVEEELDAETQVEVLLSYLSARDREIVSKRYGLPPYRPHTVKELAQQYGAGVSRRLHKILTKLRSAAEELGLRDFVGS